MKKRRIPYFIFRIASNTFADDLQTVNFEETLQADVIAEVMSARLEETPNSLRFLAGKVKFLHTFTNAFHSF